MNASTKVLFLYTAPASYLSRCLVHLSLQPDIKIHIVFKSLKPSFFDLRDYTYPITYSIKPQNFKKLLHHCLHFEPTIIFISGWIDHGYLRIGRFFQKCGIPIIGLSDTPLKRNLRQKIGKWYVRGFLKNIFSAFWVSGKNAENLIRYLGWTTLPVFHGFYTADHQIYSPSILPHQRPSFLFVGRLEKIKGIKILIAAYQWYRSTVRNPWPLKVAGTGSLHQKLPNSIGIEYLGHLDHPELAVLYRQSSCFILPSLNEPWGVVIHEAASSGLPMILSDNCGARELFLLPNINGWIWQNKDYKSLGTLMIKAHFTSALKLKRFGKKSQELSFRLSIQHWIKTFAAIKSI